MTTQKHDPCAVDIYSLPRVALLSWFQENGIPESHAGKLWRNLYRPAAPTSPPPARETPNLEIPNPRTALNFLPEKYQNRLEALCASPLPKLVREVASRDGLTRKFLLQLADGSQIETVLMRYDGRATACLSTQVGCAMGCVFCATGKLGFRRNLTTSEIIAQALLANAALRENNTSLRNVVFMGMGEPLANYDNVQNAIAILSDSGGFALRRERISLSTVGIVPAIRRLSAEPAPVSLAVSLHAATQEERAALIPAAKNWHLDSLLDACREYNRTANRKVFFEWTLIRGKNDTPQTAAQLAALLQGLDAHVNLIPLNPVAGFAGEAAERESARQFQNILRANNIPSTLRQYRGLDIAAGCGQLAAASK